MSLLSPWDEHGRIQLTQHRDGAAPGQGRGLTAGPGMGQELGAGLLAGDNALEGHTGHQEGGLNISRVWLIPPLPGQPLRACLAGLKGISSLKMH